MFCLQFILQNQNFMLLKKNKCVLNVISLFTTKSKPNVNILYVWQFHSCQQYNMVNSQHWLTCKNKKDFIVQSAGAVEHNDCFSAKGEDPTTIVLDMILNDLMVRVQYCWNFGECRAPLYCHCSGVHSGPEWQHLIVSYPWVKQN